MDDWAAALALLKVSTERDVSPSRAHSLADAAVSPEPSAVDMLFASNSSTDSSSSHISGALKSAHGSQPTALQQVFDSPVPYGKLFVLFDGTMYGKFCLGSFCMQTRNYLEQFHHVIYLLVPALLLISPLLFACFGLTLSSCFIARRNA